MCIPIQIQISFTALHKLKRSIERYCSRDGDSRVYDLNKDGNTEQEKAVLHISCSLKQKTARLPAGHPLLSDPPQTWFNTPSGSL